MLSRFCINTLVMLCLRLMRIRFSHALKEWDKDFVNVDLDTLYHLIMAANFMNVKGLLGLTCQRFAVIIHGKTSEEIRQTFGIKNDFTLEEEERLHARHQEPVGIL